MNDKKTPRRSAPYLQRLLGASLGGYLLASAWVVFCGALSRHAAESILAGMQVGLVIHVAAAIWSFSPVPLARMWLGLLVPAALLLAASGVLMHWRG